MTTKLGYTDLSTVALDRMDWAAQRASDAVLGAVRQYLRALAYLRASDYRTGKRLIQLGMSALENAEAGRVRDVVVGHVHLGAAVLAGRDQDEDAAMGHLDEAQTLAVRTGPAEKVHWLSFGPVNVGAHKVSVLAELNQYQEGRPDFRVARGSGGLATLPAVTPPSRNRAGPDVDRPYGRRVPKLATGAEAGAPTGAVRRHGAGDVRRSRIGEAPNAGLLQQLRPWWRCPGGR
ncbi:hypothetical protein [Actinacidiphila sp. ITFR-21]|uniref:hypothetical protein n=1 Tax=Actinacidiphila sp. ITFR-21 TaxID=3075199 RepID=UPI00288C527A|nr:hypothetical protein [Streptomyces sp. ITFR-21]WNI17318.1 hypothetical protein RLT57_18545 [Streptomyces sp. ITFR-21]